MNIISLIKLSHIHGHTKGRVTLKSRDIFHTILIERYKFVGMMEETDKTDASDGMICIVKLDLWLTLLTCICGIHMAILRPGLYAARSIRGGEVFNCFIEISLSKKT